MTSWECWLEFYAHGVVSTREFAEHWGVRPDGVVVLARNAAMRGGKWR